MDFTDLRNEFAPNRLGSGQKKKRRRPRKQPKSEPLAFRLSQVTDTRLNYVCSLLGIGRSEYARRSIEKSLDEYLSADTGPNDVF